MPAQEHRLAAIMFTDIVGYTAMIGSDEKATLKLLDDSVSMHKSMIGKFNGSLLKLMGDGTLTCFGSASDAVLCAQELVKASKDIPNLRLRIGIHEGEVIFKDDDVIGDGVNIASRISDLAKEDNILISDTIYHNIKNKDEIHAEYYGKKKLKNVDHLIRIYQVIGEKRYGKSIYHRLRSKSRQLNKYATVIIVSVLLIVGFFTIRNIIGEYTDDGIHPPRLAVLPLVSLSDDPEQEFFCYGLADEMINQLQKIGGLVIRSRTSSFKYMENDKTTPEIAKELDVDFIIEGSVLRAGDSIRIIVQLIDGNTDEHIWAETYQENYDDIFSIMSSIPRMVAGSLSAEITPETELQIDRIPTRNIVAYSTYLKGIASLSEYYFSNDDNDYNQATQYFKSSIALDDKFADAYSYLAQTYRTHFRFGNISHFGQGTEWTDSVINICNKAIELDPYQSLAYSNLGDIYNLRNEKKQAEIAFQKLLELNPNGVEALWPLGLYYREIGKYAEALSLYTRLKTAEHRQFLPFSYCVTGNIYLTIGDLKNAEKDYLESLNLQPDFYGGHLDLAILEMIKGNFEKSLMHNLMNDSLNPGDINNHYPIINSYILLNEFEKADHRFSIFLDTLKKRPNFEWVYLHVSNLNAYILWNTNRRDQAIEELNASIEFLEKKVKDPIPFDRRHFFWIALAKNHALLGNKEEVYRVLHEYEDQGITHDMDLYLQHDPVFRILWEDKEFNDFLKRADETKKARIEEVRKLHEVGLI